MHSNPYSQIFHRLIFRLLILYVYRTATRLALYVVHVITSATHIVYPHTASGRPFRPYLFNYCFYLTSTIWRYLFASRKPQNSIFIWVLFPVRFISSEFTANGPLLHLCSRGGHSYLCAPCLPYRLLCLWCRTYMVHTSRSVRPSVRIPYFKDGLTGPGPDLRGCFRLAFDYKDIAYQYTMQA